MLLFAGLVGCQDYRWKYFDSVQELRQFEQTARDQGKLLFIFYKWCLDSDANRMHGDVLADNEVGKLFLDTTNIVIDKFSGPEYEDYLKKFGVTDPPACILVAPDGRYKVFTGYIPKERFMELIKAAKQDLTEQSRRPPPSLPKP